MNVRTTQYIALLSALPETAQQNLDYIQGPLWIKPRIARAIMHIPSSHLRRINLSINTSQIEPGFIGSLPFSTLVVIKLHFMTIVEHVPNRLNNILRTVARQLESHPNRVLQVMNLTLREFNNAFVSIEDTAPIVRLFLRVLSGITSPFLRHLTIDPMMSKTTRILQANFAEGHYSQYFWQEKLRQWRDIRYLQIDDSTTLKNIEAMTAMSPVALLSHYGRIGYPIF